MALTIIESQGIGVSPKILTQKEVEQRCLKATKHNKRHVSSFSNKVMKCELCGALFSRYSYLKKR